MDSITYLLDPAEPMTMVNIITHHTCFTTDIVKLAAPVQAAKYNLYDCANDHASHLALVNCFDDALHLEIEEHLPNDPTFHILWMMFVQIVQSDSMGKFTQMTNEIKQQTTQMYAGQNIAEMALAISTCATALSTAGHYDLQLNGMILKTFLLADGNDEYRFELMKMQSQLTTASKQVRFMADKHAASAFLTNLGLGHTQLCALCEGKYREAVGDGIWPPTQRTPRLILLGTTPLPSSMLLSNSLVRARGTVVPPHVTNRKMSSITVVKLGIGLRIALRKPRILLLDVSLVVVTVAVVLVVAVLVARMSIVVVVMDTTLVVVEGEMAILVHDACLLHGSWRPPDLVNLKPFRRMDKPSIGVSSARLLSGRPRTALPPMAPMGIVLRPMPWPPTLLPCPLTHLLGWLM